MTKGFYSTNCELQCQEQNVLKFCHVWATIGYSEGGELAHLELSVYWLVFLVGNVLAWSFFRLNICNFDKHLIAPGKTIFSQKINDAYCATGQR